MYNYIIVNNERFIVKIFKVHTIRVALVTVIFDKRKCLRLKEVPLGVVLVIKEAKELHFYYKFYNLIVH